MPTIYAVGNDGSVKLPSNYDMNVKVWAANLTYVSTDTTGFSHSAKTRRLGVLDITGTLAGQPSVGAGASTSPFGTISGGSVTGIQAGGEITLASYGSATAATNATNVAYLQFGAVFSQYAFNADKNGDQTLTVSFECNDSNGPTVVWATSA